jgi:hypothetical protein
MQIYSNHFSRNIAQASAEVFFVTQALMSYDIMTKSDIAVTCVHLMQVADALDKLEQDLKDVNEVKAPGVTPGEI